MTLHAPFSYPLADWTRAQTLRADVLIVFANGGDRLKRFVSSPAYRRRLLAFRSLVTRTIDDAGHMMHHDQPAAFARLIEEHVG